MGDQELATRTACLQIQFHLKVISKTYLKCLLTWTAAKTKTKIRCCLPSASQTCSIGERSDLAGHGRTSYVEDIVGRVAQYVDEHYLVDKWHPGRLDSMGKIGVKISSTYYTSCQSAIVKNH
ncbi:hypothetical protein TNCV_3594631 [Trichonephila clavipes]|nr:hypothetical protein TNCV_3594631 [Trichonephila clavipes]